MSAGDMNKSKATRTPPPRWQCISLPLIAGFLHLQVFYYAVFHCISRAIKSEAEEFTSEEFRNECFLLDRAIFIAYMFDLMCCYLKVIPFSRSRNPKDIIGHHVKTIIVPTLVLALPLAIPLWGNLRSLESTSFSILDFNIGNENRNYFINSYTMASGFAYISSLNEVFMCFQRVEMSIAGVDSFREIPQMKSRFFTSRFVIGAELCYKLFFFWGMSLVACKACCDFDKSLYDSIIASHDYDKSIWRTLLTIYSSPAVLRGALFRAFSVVMYPSMGARCLKKIKEFYREGKAIKSS
ncbi:hypothetical protein ACHAXR_009012 [Thalassiosira sp. AJA248-18]